MLSKEAINQNQKFIVLTGGPGGGKTTLIDELLTDPSWSERIAVLPEAISLMHQIGLSPKQQRFQRTMVYLQMALEDGLQRAFKPFDLPIIICHRGSLDPLAYWLDRGWSQEAFFVFTETNLSEHLQRYRAVIHLVTAADGANAHYIRWPQSHRLETTKDAVRIDRLLHQAWSTHPAYYRIDNQGKDWAAKSQVARSILSDLLNSDRCK